MAVGRLSSATRIPDVNQNPIGTNFVVASGGTETTYTSDGKTYKVHTFTGSGTLNVTMPGNADILVVGGGGGSPNSWAHGGAGAVRWGIFALTAGSIAVTVGAGGAGGVSHGDAGFSALGNILRAGGGQGGRQLNSRRNGLGGGGSSGGINTTDGNQSHSGGGAGGTVYGASETSGITLSITGSAVEYGRGGFAGAGTGFGYGSTASGGNGSAGVVIIRYEFLSAPLRESPAIVSSHTGTYSTYTGDGTNGIAGRIYDVYTFTGSGSITLAAPGFADVLIVGGGGGAGLWSAGNAGGGGGGGGMLVASSTFLPVGSSTIVVGAGGAGGVSDGGGLQGVTSRMGTLYAVGGVGH